ncbi:MAG: MarR family transcriptional regulator [Gammaproteobacteria bacterium]|nr:MarR family transcriptional regulator [Gammaproteobacteria bacterium]MYD77285.1 MarR family transcriptional regulator [Gammaproteobacteria bacterium]MYJ52575.1 MarR family transcriptional regulator [Gammaproteobacteria bacterium]
MKRLKIGIMSREQFQRRAVDIAAGKINPKRGEPKIWFSSIRSLSEVLSDNNVRLLKLIDEHQPETLQDLAQLSGRKSSNLSRTLKTMEKYGIVELRKHDSRKVQPIAKATEFDIQYAIV